MYLSQLCRVENKVVPMSELRITKDALVDRDGVQIDVLYRQTYPIEDLMRIKILKLEIWLVWSYCNL